MKKLIFIGLVSMLLVSCSSPKQIVLTDGSVIRTKDEPEYKRKQGIYEYEDEDGKKGSVNAQSVKIIQPIGSEVPKTEEPLPVVEEEAVEAQQIPEAAPEATTETQETPLE